MNDRPLLSRSKLIFVWLALGIGLVGVAIYAGSKYPLPVVGVQTFGVSQRSAAVFWLQDPRRSPEFVHQFDLQTGQVSRVPFRQQAMLGTRTSRGQRVQMFGRLELIDDESGELLWSGKPPGNYLTLVGDHYLLEPLDDKFRVFDLDELTGLGPKDAPAPAHGDAQLMIFDVPGVRSGSPGFQRLFPIEGTNRFLYQFQSPSAASVTAFELIGRELRTLASWPTAVDTVAIQYNGTVMSAAATGTEVEVRSLEDFQLVKKHPLPSGLKAWAGQGVIFSKNDLFSFSDTRTGVTRVHRFDDFTLVPELDMTVFGGGLKTSRFDDRRYTLLGDRAYQSSRLVVYDALKRKIVVDRAPPTGAFDMRIVDGQLVFVSEMLGFTVEVVDLKTGQSVKRFQPFAWIVFVLPGLLLLALGWLVVWLRLTSHWTRLAVCNILIITALFVTPQLAHVAMLGGARILFRPAMAFSCLTLVVLSFGLSLYAVFGRQRVLLRTVPVWLGTATVLALANLYVDENGKRGLDGLQGMVGESLRVLVMVSFVSIAVLLCMRTFGFRLGHKHHSVAEPANATIPLRDIFVFTACIAAFLAAAAPNRALLLEPVFILGSTIASLILAAPILLGLISLAPSVAIYRFMRFIVIALALLLIVEITLHVSMGYWQRQIWFMVLMLVRLWTFPFLVSFTFGSILRSAGYRWQRANVIKSRVKETALPTPG